MRRMSLLAELPDAVSSAYLAQSNFWLTWLPMRGFLAFCESSAWPTRAFRAALTRATAWPSPDDLANLLKLVLVTTTYLFVQTPRAVRKRSEPPKFKYSQNYASLVSLARVAVLSRARTLARLADAQSLPL